MLPPEAASSLGDSDLSERAVRNLRDQVCQLESALLARQELLQQCQGRQAVFEHAAAERLHVINQGHELLQARAEMILALQKEAAELRQQVGSLTEEVASHAEEQQRLQRACREAGRGMEELANRERALTRENLELRNEGLLHSIIRRLSSIFT